MQIAMIQDKIMPAKEIEEIYFDRGIFFGDGVYEVIRSYNGRIFALEEHLQRFAGSLSGIEITGVDIDLIRSRILKAFDAAGIADAKIQAITRHKTKEMTDHYTGFRLEHFKDVYEAQTDMGTKLLEENQENTE